MRGYLTQTRTQVVQTGTHGREGRDLIQPGGHQGKHHHHKGDDVEREEAPDDYPDLLA